MATNARICVYDGKTVTAQYVHYDGYVEGVGKILMGHYTDIRRIKELVALGDLSMLGERLHPTGPHGFHDREDGVTLAYRRDGGETGVDSESYKKTFKTIKEAFNFLIGKYQDDYTYLYVTSKNTWYVCEYGEDPVTVREYLGGNKTEPVPIIPPPKKQAKKILTREQATEVARKLRLNQELLYGLHYDSQTGTLTGKYVDNKNAPGYLFTMDWVKYEKVAERPTQAHLADYLYHKCNHLAKTIQPNRIT